MRIMSIMSILNECRLQSQKELHPQLAQLPNLSTFSIAFQWKLSKLPQNVDFKDLFTRLAGNVANSDKKLNAHYEHYEHFE